MSTLGGAPRTASSRWGSDYLELIAVVDPAVADTTAFGRTLLALTADGRDRWFELCLADTDVEATAARLGLEVEPGLRTTPDGREIRWHGAGLEEDVRRPYLPFFITWDVPDDLMPGRMAADHRTPASGIDTRRGRGRRRGPAMPGSAAPACRSTSSPAPRASRR